ncbi:MAG: hypothetical protein J1F43_03140 [Muribaculaceae bacterium]|nr:hypothetical protein [Muribaculaceae bacterium]
MFWNLCNFCNAEVLKIRTIESYILSPTFGKTDFNDKTVIFELDTLNQTLDIKSVIGKNKYTISNYGSSINKSGDKIIRFEVKEGDIMTKKYVITIPPILTGNIIQVKETMSTPRREMFPTVYSTDKYFGENDPKAYITKYLDKYFHEIKETTPMMDNKCSISYSDQAVMIADLEGTNEMHILLVTSKEDTSVPIYDKIQTIYHCETDDEQYLFIVDEPENDDNIPTFHLTRLVYGEPVVTTTYFSDIIN